MKRNLFLFIIIIILFALIFYFSILQTEEENLESPEIVVESLKINGQEGRIITIGLENESIITAVVTNDGNIEKEAELILSVKKDGELFDRRHNWIYTIKPGETKEIEEIREVHYTWYKGEFTVEIGDMKTKVIVE